MTRKTRRTIFYALFVLFLLIGAAVILYAEGWRVNFNTWRTNKVGAIYVRSFPKDAQIYLNGKPLENKSGLLSPGTLLSDLFPGSYSLTLKESGYADWHENVTVLPSLVSQLSYAVLVPTGYSSVVASGTPITAFSIISGETISEGVDGTITWRGQTLGNGTIVSESTDLKNIVMQDPATGVYSLRDLTSTTTTNLSLVFARNGISTTNITGVTIDPFDATKVIVKTPSRIWLYDMTRATFTPIGTAAAGSELGNPIAISPSLFAWMTFANASGTSHMVLYDPFAKTTTQSSSTIAGENNDLKWVRPGVLAALQNDGALYLYDPSSQTFQKLADDVKDFEATDNGSMIAALEYQSLEIFPFTNDTTYYRFNIPDVSEVQDLIWYKDQEHLFVQYADHISLLDLADLGLSNFTTVAEGTSPFYAKNPNILYFIDTNHELSEVDMPQ